MELTFTEMRNIAGRVDLCVCVCVYRGKVDYKGKISGAQFEIAGDRECKPKSD